MEFSEFVSQVRFLNNAQFLIITHFSSHAKTQLYYFNQSEQNLLDFTTVELHSISDVKYVSGLQIYWDTYIVFYEDFPCNCQKAPQAHYIILNRKMIVQSQ